MLFKLANLVKAKNCRSRINISVVKAMCIVICCLQGAMGYSAMSGSCNGVWGVHLPNSDGGGDGGYILMMGPTSVDSKGNRTASVTITHISFMSNATQQQLQSAKGSGYFRGFLLKAFDPYTGLLVGTFNGPLPVNTMYYDGCSSAQSAISHNMKTADSDASTVVTTQHALTFR